MRLSSWRALCAITCVVPAHSHDALSRLQTVVAAWSSPAANAKCAGREEKGNGTAVVDPSVRAMGDRPVPWKTTGGRVGAPDPNTPSVLYNAMIVPYTVRGSRRSCARARGVVQGVLTVAVNY